MLSPYITGDEVLVTVLLFMLIGWIVLKAYNNWALEQWIERMSDDDHDG